MEPFLITVGSLILLAVIAYLAVMVAARDPDHSDEWDDDEGPLYVILTEEEDGTWSYHGFYLDYDAVEAKTKALLEEDPDVNVVVEAF